MYLPAVVRCKHTARNVADVFISMRIWIKQVERQNGAPSPTRMVDFITKKPIIDLEPNILFERIE